MANAKHKIAIVVDLRLLREHIGVATYLHSVYQLLKQSDQVDLVVGEATGANVVWSRIDLAGFRQGWLPDDDEVCFSGTALEVWRQYRQGRRRLRRRPSVPHYQTMIGSDLAIENYDLAIIAAPWLITAHWQLPIARIVGMVYDIVPNEYAVLHSEPNESLLEFAHKHAVGYAYYARNCCRVLAISPEAADGFNRYFSRPNAVRAESLPPVVPVHATNSALSDAPRANKIALAAPFDIRKGIREIPQLVSPLADQIQELLVYGVPRCAKAELKVFFQRLGKLPIRWWPLASAAQVQQIYSTAKLLLFPSHQEGLGLPILEAQALGCPVVVRDQAPMNRLIGPGSRLLTGSSHTDVQTLQSLLNDPMDAQQLRAWTHATFDNQLFLQRFRDALASESVPCSV